MTLPKWHHRHRQFLRLELTAGLSISIVLISFVSQQAHAWGSYAHQQINLAAVQMLFESNTTSPIAQCMKTNVHMIQRFAITPDYDWKFGLGRAPTDPVAIEGQKTSDPYEHPLHFFEADAFESNPDAFIVLPSGKGDYNSVFSKYQTLVEGHKSFIAKVDPPKAEITDPINKVLVHGTAPWRIYQLYNLAVQNLAAYTQDHSELSLQKALLYLGAMGHYVGDMSQPLHAAADFDGQYNFNNSAQNPSHAIGVHSGFESDMFDVLIGEKENPTDFTYASFATTQQNVLNEGRIYFGQSWDKIDKTEIVTHVFQLISGGYKYIPNLVSNFADDVDANPKDAAPARMKRKTSAVVPLKPRSPASAKKTGKLTQASEPAITVLRFAENRMGDAAALLSRLWLSAYQDALEQAGIPIALGSPQIARCPALTFADPTRTMAIQNYPIPDFLPTGHEKLPNYQGEPKSIRPSAAAVHAFTAHLIN